MNRLQLTRVPKAIPVLSAVTFVGFLDTHLLIPVMALYAHELGAGIVGVGVIVGLYSIVNTPANIWLGRLVDKLGYRLPLIGGLIGDALSMFLYTLCRRPFHLALVRVLHGLTGGMVGPATMAAVAYHGGERRGRAMAFYGMALAAATLVGYGLSSLMVARAGYNAVFWLGGALLVGGAALGFTLPGNRGKPAEPSSGGWRQAAALLKRPGLVGPYAAIFAQYFSFGGVVTLLPLYIEGLGMEAFQVGMLLAAFAVMFIILQLPSGRLGDRVGRFGLTVVGLGLGITALVLLPVVASLAWLFIIMALYGAAYGLLFPTISARVAEVTAPGERGLATGVFHALLTAGVAVGAPVMGWLGSLVGVTGGLQLTAVMMIVALVVALVYRRAT